MSREIHKLLGPMSRRLRLTASRAVVGNVADGGKMQTAQAKLLATEVRDAVERFQSYGLTSVPLAGAEGVFLSLNGSRDQGVLIVVDDRRYRLRGLQDGEVALYDDLGQKVHLTRTGITVKTDQTLRLEGKDVQIHGTHSFSWDVNGYGWKATSTGGANYEIKTWQTGAAVSTVAQSISPPEGP